MALARTLRSGDLISFPRMWRGGGDSLAPFFPAPWGRNGHRDQNARRHVRLTRLPLLEAGFDNFRGAGGVAGAQLLGFFPTGSSKSACSGVLPSSALPPSGYTGCVFLKCSTRRKDGKPYVK